MLCKEIAAAAPHSSAPISATCSPPHFRQWVVGHRQDFHLSETRKIYFRPSKSKAVVRVMEHYQPLNLIGAVNEKDRRTGYKKDKAPSNTMLEMSLVCSPGQHGHGYKPSLTCAARHGHSYFIKQTPDLSAICGRELKYIYI